MPPHLSRDALKDAAFLRMALSAAHLSTCTRLHTGAVITDWSREKMWIGYNGGPKGEEVGYICSPEKEGSCGCVHAEANACIKAEIGMKKRAYLTDSPCILCAASLINAGVEWIMYLRPYRDTSGIDRCKRLGIEVMHAPARIMFHLYKWDSEVACCGPDDWEVTCRI